MTTATSNTHIRIKRSSANSAPDLLQAGELAYSYVSNTAFIGTADGLGVLKIGGEAYTAIIDSANTQNSSNTLVLRDVDGSFAANVVTANYFVGDGSQLTGLVTNLTFTGDTGGPNTLSLLTDTLTLTGGEGITSTIDGNTVTFDVDDTVLRSNTEGSSQHISTDVLISGNLTVQGTTTYVQTSINQTDDSMIELAANNTVGDVLDIGFYGKHELGEGGGTVVTGLVRNAGTSDYYLFDNIAIGDEANLTSNLITQGALSANGASLYAYQFLAAEGVGSTGGFSFNNDGGLDTGMFSPADGELNFYSNSDKTFSANGDSFNVSTYAQFDGSVRVTGGQSLWMNNGDNTGNIQINNNGISGNSGLFVDSLASGETSNIVFYNTSTKELTYGTMSDLRPDRLANNSYSWEVDGTTGALFSDQGVYIADNSNSVIIGQNVDLNNTNTNRVVIGNNAGNNNQGYGSTAVGENAGQTNQGFLSVAIGVNAGNDTQGHSSVAIGHTAGRTSQGTDAIAIGVAAGLTTQGQYAVAVGERAGYTGQGQYAVSLGSESGYTNQTQYAVAIGYQAGYTSQSEGAIALGQGAGYTTQAYRAVAVGHNAGYNNQGYKAVAIGKSAGEQNQGQDSVAVGHRAGNSSQSLGGVAIGYHAGDTSQGQYSIAIGYRAGLSNQVTNSIVFDAMNSALSPVNAGLYINPIRYVDTQDVDYDGIAFYNASTKEMTYSYVLDGGVF